MSSNCWWAELFINVLVISQRLTLYTGGWSCMLRPSLSKKNSFFLETRTRTQLEGACWRFHLYYSQILRYHLPTPVRIKATHLFSSLSLLPPKSCKKKVYLWQHWGFWKGSSWLFWWAHPLSCHLASLWWCLQSEIREKKYYCLPQSNSKWYLHKQSKWGNMDANSRYQEKPLPGQSVNTAAGSSVDRVLWVGG